MNRTTRRLQNGLTLIYRLTTLLTSLAIDSFRKHHLGRFLRELFFSSLFLLKSIDRKFRMGPFLNGAKNIADPVFSAERSRFLGLHQLLAGSPSFSILIPVFRPRAEWFKQALESSCLQTAPKLEVVVAYDGPQPPEVYAVTQAVKKDPQFAHVAIKEVQCDRTADTGGISRTTNAAANVATGDFYILMDHDDWIRPDLTYRYAQMLSLVKDPKETVFYCNELKIDENGDFLSGSTLRKPSTPPFPFVFTNFICHCLAVPAELWHKLEGLRPHLDGAQDYDLCLRLKVAGANFINVPATLYAWRSHSQSTAQSFDAKDYATPAGVQALQDFCRSQGLNWKIEPGIIPTSYRAVPQITQLQKIHAIVPFHNQKELTLRAVKSLKEQKDVQVTITCVDNRSSDSTIAEDLRKQDVEVFVIDEPFNYSRINNRAVSESQKGKDCDLVLFMNNDVELEADALLEMARWAQEPLVGIVGCLLKYPNGTVQHGGVVLAQDGPRDMQEWVHIGQANDFEYSGWCRTLLATDAVTAACALMRKSVFQSVKGFDELLYPIAYSDTQLCVKVRSEALTCLYTPFARGTHHESVTRGFNALEDFERSTQLANALTGQRNHESLVCY